MILTHICFQSIIHNHSRTSLDLVLDVIFEREKFAALGATIVTLIAEAHAVRRATIVTLIAVRVNPSRRRAPGVRFRGYGYQGQDRARNKIRDFAKCMITGKPLYIMK